MIHFTPEDLNSCGLVKKSDKGPEGAARVLSTMAKTTIAYVKEGPVSAILTAKEEADKIHAAADTYHRSDWHQASCTSPFCRGCK